VNDGTAAAPHAPAAPPAQRVPWALAAASAWAPALGQTPQTGFVLDTLAASLQESTARSYGRHWDSFVAWCAAQADSPSPLPASTATVLRYLGDIGVRGTVKADSLQPYLSAINAAHRDLMLPLPALGDAVSRFRRGLANRQVAAGRPAARVYLPARVVCSALRWALQATPSSLVGDGALLFRAAVALVLNYVWFARGDTGAALRCCDIDTSDGIALVNVREKGKSHRASSRVIRIPRGALPDVERLLHRWEAFRGSRPAESSYFALPGELRTAQRRFRPAVLDDWMQLVLVHLGERAPLGQSWSSHSARKGAASSANAVGASLAKICHMGGWSVRSNVIFDYIDPTCPADAWCARLFGWLAPAPPRSVSLDI